MGEDTGTGRDTPKAGQVSLGDLFWVGTACALSVVVGMGLGYLFDQLAHTLPWLTFAGLAFGIVMAVVIAVRQLRRVS
ncbi:MAG: AtpZ/AtpI family protein [Acidimicrobiales bacterium]